MPGRGSVANPGLVGVMPASGEIMIPPFSVCHQVSTMGHCPLPTSLLYHSQASSLIGSPTLPNTSGVLKLYFSTHSGTAFVSALIAVGAVYKCVTPYFSQASQMRPASG